MQTRLRRTGIVAAAGAGAALLGVAAALAGATYPDPKGDVKAGTGPDITAVSISHTAKVVTFRVRFAAKPALGVSKRWVDMLLIGLDVPPRGPRPTPSGWLGANYSAGLHGAETRGMLVQATGRPGWKVVARFKVVREGRTLSFSLDRRWIGNPAWFDFMVSAGRETLAQADTGGVPDVAPASGTFRYRLTG